MSGEDRKDLSTKESPEAIKAVFESLGGGINLAAHKH
jgi:hypothetical protein